MNTEQQTGLTPFCRHHHQKPFNLIGMFRRDEVGEGEPTAIRAERQGCDMSVRQRRIELGQQFKLRQLPKPHCGCLAGWWPRRNLETHGPGRGSREPRTGRPTVSTLKLIISVVVLANGVSTGLTVTV